MSRIKTRDLRSKKKEELLQQLEEQKQELASILVRILWDFQHFNDCVLG
jgi:hypothetical protein